MTDTRKKLIERINDDIGRIYVFDDGSRYYSVTTMLGKTADKSTIKAWRDRVGHEKADRICTVATNIGTMMHEYLEKYLKKEEIVGYTNMIKKLSNQIIPFMDKKVGNVHFTEQFIYSERLQLAGTIDGLVDYLINGQYYLTALDFKTSKKQPRIDWIRDYFLQLCVYSLMIEEIYGKYPEYGVLLFAYKEEINPAREVIVKTRIYEESLMKRIEMFRRMI